MNLPAEIFASLLKRLLEKLAETPENLVLEKRWQEVRPRFTSVWIADGSTLEQLRKRLKVSEEKGGKLGGKIRMIVEAFTQILVTVWYQENEKCNDKTWWEELINKLPKSSLIIVDLGFFSLGAGQTC
jgi:hypothetical protein